MQHQVAILPEILYAVRFHNEPRITRRGHQNYLYVVAATISANNRKLRQLITLCEQIATPTEQAALKKLKTRINLWAVAHAHLGYFTSAATNSSDSIV